MTTAPYILARTFAEAHSFATDDLGLGKGHYRVVNSSGTLKAVRGVKLYLVPGWRQRFDRFAMQSALRWTRMDVVDVAEERAKAPEPTNDDLDTPDGLKPAGVQLTIDTGVDSTSPETLDGEVLVSDELAHTFVTTRERAEESAPRRRRRRCDDCGILVDPDDVEQHAAQHTTEGV